MRITAFLLLVCALKVSAKSYSQDRITLNLKDVSITRVFSVIQEKTDYKFLYNNEDVQNAPPISISVKDATVPQILENCFRDYPLMYQIENKVVVISSKADLSHIYKDLKKVEFVEIKPVQFEVKGKVTDENGKPLAGVSVTLKNNNKIGTTTDNNGDYSLSVESGDGTLVFSSVGHSTQEVEMNGRNVINVALSIIVTSLNQVVVIGYGTTLKKNLVGAVDQITSGTFENRPVGNVEQALQGASPNLIIQTSSFNPNGNNMNINIRGVGTLGSNTPLVVIDGLITDFVALNNLNPMDIASISILKDAGSAAIYGSRSASGVILVTTKQGKKNEKMTVRLSGQYGTVTPHLFLKPVKGYENAILRNEANANVGVAPLYTPEQIQNLAKGDSKWIFDQILQNATQQSYTASISGGSKLSSYMISAGYLDQGSNYIGPDYGVKRYNFHMNEMTEYKRFKFTGIVDYTRQDTRDYAGDKGFVVADAQRTPVYNTYVMKAPNGKYLLNDVLSQYNPVGELEAGGVSLGDNDALTGSLNGELTLMNGLKLKGVFGGTIRSSHLYIHRLPVPFYASADATIPIDTLNPRGDTYDYNQKVLMINSQIMLDFDRTFNNVHRVSALVGASNESYTSKANSIQKFYTDPVLAIPVSNTILDPGSSSNTPSNTDQNSIESVFGRATYSYMERYYGEFDFRYDGSSKFASNKRWGFFPSLSLGWRASEESFMSKYKEHVGDLKIRASYGILGNQNVNDYQYQTVYNVYNNMYAFNGSPVSGAGFTFANPSLTWERAATTNIGADFTFLKSALTVSADYFYKRTTDILLTPTVPSVYGGAVPAYNAGIVGNKGWEASIGYHVKTGNFHHNFNINIANTQNKVLFFNGVQIHAEDVDAATIIKDGLPINAYYGYITDGFFQSFSHIQNSPIPSGATLQPGDVKFKDLNGNGTIDPEDRTVLGDAFPHYTFGFAYSVTWKDIDLNFLIQGVGKRAMMLRGETVTPYQGNYGYTMYTNQLDYWTPVNPNPRYPGLTAPGSASYVNNWQNPSTLFLFNGAYARLKNIALGYTLPSQVASKLGMQKLRAYINAQNLFTLAATKFTDPETTEFNSNMGVGGANSVRNYPTPIYYGVGLDIEF
ncbi:MAG: TonB-dependent receptor [Chitinophagaceae bacterium]|nr:TonB-dependent receptor [Chitinophagaceae bacterium]